MPPTDEDTLKRRYREFLDLMPLTIEIAGLHASSGPVNFNQEQMDVRAQTLLQAFKIARQMARDSLASG
jgi:hypothetical protein